MPKDYREFKASGFVSVWTGSITDEIELDDYLRENFPSDFGMSGDIGRVAESTVSEEPQEVSRLVNGFSQWKTYEKACVETAGKKGVATASCMVVFYGVKYDEREIRNPGAPLRFLGVFSTTQPA